MNVKVLSTKPTLLQDDLRKIASWSEGNSFSLNLHKSKSINFKSEHSYHITGSGQTDAKSENDY